MADSFLPSPSILKKYAHVLVNYALNSGEGVKKGEVVDIVVPDVAKPLALELQNAVLEAGAHPMLRLMPTGFDRDFFERASDDQLTFFPKQFLKSRVDLVDHTINVIADVDPFELEHVDPSKMVKAREAKKEYIVWRTDKEAQGKYTWTLGLWGVESKAALVGLSLEDYWNQIIQACFLDEEDPVARWKKISQQQQHDLARLNDMKIEWLHVKGDDADLKVKLGADRIWNGGSGRNIPSFELFTSPDWRGSEGWIRFNQPLYRYGQVIKDVELKFEQGVVTKATASQGQDMLEELIKGDNANKMGEYSLTDKRMSRITHVMAETLFDENIGGPFGNTHLAVGMSYKDCYRGDQSALTKEEWAAKGFNFSAEHTDIISTTDRTVTATLGDGTERVIYADGQFQL